MVSTSFNGLPSSHGAVDMCSCMANLGVVSMHCRLLRAIHDI
jgi:hypothetical protein